jgi:hypothetical protein
MPLCDMSMQKEKRKRKGKGKERWKGRWISL